MIFLFQSKSFLLLLCKNSWHSQGMLHHSAGTVKRWSTAQSRLIRSSWDHEGLRRMRENAHHSQELPIAARGWSRHSSVDDEQLHCASPEFHSFLSLCLSVSVSPFHHNYYYCYFSIFIKIFYFVSIIKLFLCQSMNLTFSGPSPHPVLTEEGEWRVSEWLNGST